MTWLQAEERDTDETYDIDPEDAYDADDDVVDWSQIETLAKQIRDIQDVGDEDERLAAAKEWAAALAGE